MKVHFEMKSETQWNNRADREGLMVAYSLNRQLITWYSDNRESERSGHWSKESYLAPTSKIRVSTTSKGIIGGQILEF